MTLLAREYFRPRLLADVCLDDCVPALLAFVYDSRHSDSFLHVEIGRIGVNGSGRAEEGELEVEVIRQEYGAFEDAPVVSLGGVPDDSLGVE